MSIWFFIWLALSGALLYFLFWTLYILFRQKRAWRLYAQKMKLRYNPRQMVESPEISGLVYGYTASMFAGEHASADTRGTRKLTAIEIHLSSRAPFDAGVASGGMVNIVRVLGLKEEMRPQSSEWHESWIASASDVRALEAYLTPERLTALVSLMKMKNAWVILIFRGDTYQYQAGAGIVADSVPESEYNEVLAKSAILSNALAIAEEGL